MSCAMAALLTYHVASLEQLVVPRPMTYFLGLTVPVLALMVLAFARTPGRRDTRSADFCWPVRLTQFLVAATYFLAGTSKLHATGFAWADGENMRAIAMSVMSMGIQEVPWAEWFAASDFRTLWGVDDRAFFAGARRLLEELREEPEPWFLTLLTVGTHHPYVVPPGAGGAPSSERCQPQVRI